MLSVIPVKTELKALLEAHTWPTSDPVIRWGGPTEGEDQNLESIYFGDVRDLDDANVSFDRRVDETYSLRIQIDVIGEGDDEQAVEARAWQLTTEVRGVLYAHHNLISDPGVMTVRLEDRRVNQTNIAIPGAWIVRITVDQTVAAIISNP
jgi:hypothetical protein